MEPSSEEKKIYVGRCHCGAVKFTVALPPLETGATSVMQCNCSICTKKGYLLVYPPVSDVTFQSGEDKLGSYTFGSKMRPHKFCQMCGTSIMIDISKSNSESLKSKYALTIRTFNDIDEILDKLKIVRGDGKHMIKPPYDIDS